MMMMYKLYSYSLAFTGIGTEWLWIAICMVPLKKSRLGNFRNRLKVDHN